jgi:phage terminase small subunit
MAQPLTPKQEAFCLAYIETGNASEAYRRAYNAGKMQPATINVAACKLLSDNKIAIRVGELKAEHAARHEITVETIRDMLMQDRDFARDLETPAAAISATMGLAKLYGHLTDKLDANIKGQIGLPDIHLGERPAE